MPVRRLNRPFTVVLTGVENAQKTTIGHLLAERNGWPLIEEAARFDAAVIAGQVALKDLQRLQDQFITEVDEQIRTSTAPVLLCDTGGLVLDIWAREVFGVGLQHTEEAMRLMDLHLLLHTMPEWHPDPLRTLPRHEDRIALQERYRARLASSGRPFAVVPMTSTDDRVKRAHDLILENSGR